MSYSNLLPALRSLWSRTAPWREPVLAIPTAAYLLGYLSRALHAYERDLGTVRVAPWEHLIAGLLILLPGSIYLAVLALAWHGLKSVAGPSRHQGIRSAIPRFWASVCSRQWS
jgi:hypothetical protein